MRHHCSRYLKADAGVSTPIPTVGATSSLHTSSPHGDAAALLLGSDSESDDDELVCEGEESDDDE